MSPTEFRNFRVDRDSRGVVTATLDVPDKPLNVFDPQVVEELYRVVQSVEQDAAAKVLVFRSGKESGFLAGADIHGIEAIGTREEAETISKLGHDLFDKIERLPIPSLAVIHGPCLGGGLEFVLACRHRIARDDAKTRLGLPEVELGLLPGWGGTQRLPKLIGLAPALPMILTGKKLSAAKAAKVGLVDLAPSPETFDAKVNRFISDLLAGKSPQPRQPKLVEKLRDRTRLGQWIVMRTARKQIGSKGKHYPALTAILKSVEAGLSGPRDKGYETERREFSGLLFSSACRSLIGLFFQRERARSQSTWVREGIETRRPRRVGVIGGGTMGAGIAQLAAFQGYDVVLKEVNEEFLKGGMQRIQKLFDEAAGKGSLRREESAARMAAITPTIAWEPFKEVDLAVEAVTEKENIKLDVFRELDRHAPHDAVLASNTSALSVTKLGEATERPNRVAGLHFFNPVHRMHLVEVVRTPSTDVQTIAALVEFVRKLGKTPIVVKDSPGFLVNRILFPYLDEAVRLYVEGVPTEKIDRAAKDFGMPMGPLELLDQVGIDVAADVSRTLCPLSPDPGPTPDGLAAMVQRGWLGKKSGTGFYTYKNGRKDKPVYWNGSAQVTEPTKPNPYPDAAALRSAVQQRLVLLLINESVRCLQEQIVEEPWMVDLAMVLGTGFAPFHGGPLRLADEWGLRGTVEQMEALAQKHGKRFVPSEQLQERLREGRPFYPPRETAKRIEIPGEAQLAGR